MDVLLAMRRAREVPVDLLRQGAAGFRLVSRLKKFGAKVPADGFIETVPVKPVIELRFDDNNSLSVAAMARGRDGLEFLRNHTGEWAPADPGYPNDSGQKEKLIDIPAENGAEETENESPQPAAEISPSAICVVPRPEDLKLVEEWLKKLVPKEFIR